MEESDWLMTEGGELSSEAVAYNRNEREVSR